MQIIFYLVIALTAFYTGSIDKRLKISRPGGVTTPLAALTVVGIIIICYVFFKTYLLLFLLLLALLKRMGQTTRRDISGLSIMVGVITAGIIAGPSGWIMLTVLGLLLFMFFLSAAEEVATSLYTIFLGQIMHVLRAARRTGNRLRNRLPRRLRFLVAVVEIPVVCSLAVAGVWQMMNWLYKPEVLSTTECIFRLIALAPVIALLYHSYLRDLSNTGAGRKRKKAVQDTPADITPTLMPLHHPASSEAV